MLNISREYLFRKYYNEYHLYLFIILIIVIEKRMKVKETKRKMHFAQH